MKKKPSNKKPRPITGYAIVSKQNPVISVLDIYSSKSYGDVAVDTHEKVIRIKITPL